MKRKSLLITVVACMLVAAISIGGTIAWLTDSDKAENKFTIGYVDIAVQEEGWTESESKSIAPDGAVDKAPYIANTGANPCLIRATYAISDSSLVTHLEVLDLPGAGWSAKQDDGWYYYLSVVPAGGKTATPLFTGIKLLYTYTELDKSVNFNIPVTAQAVQSENMKGINGTGTETLAAVMAAFDLYETQHTQA